VERGTVRLADPLVGESTLTSDELAARWDVRAIECRPPPSDAR